MNWWINNGGLIAADEDKLRNPMDHGWIPFERFEELTGKRINWKVRENKFITSVRKKGHLKLYDESFIAGETYKIQHKVYKCEHIDKDGNALLIPRGNALKAITARDTKDWEIYEDTAVSTSTK
jgi:hypothetical protein